MGDAIVDFFLGIGRAIREASKDWARFAHQEPGPAAERLDMIAAEIDLRVKNREARTSRISKGRVAKGINAKLRARAKMFRDHADDLRKRARGEMCERNPYRKPGT